MSSIAFQDVVDGAQNLVYSAAAGLGTLAAGAAKAAQVAGVFLLDCASKIAEFVKPYFVQLKNFAHENRQSLIIAGVAFAVGAVATMVANHVFCRGAIDPNDPTKKGQGTQIQNPQLIPTA